MRSFENAACALQELLRLRGLSPKALAEEAGIDPACVRNILRGKQKSVSTRNLVGFARALDISLMELIDRLS